MAEERNLALQRASASGDEEATKEELQRRMEEARESITQTVSEIKETVATQYQNVKDALDWREQFRRRPLAFSLGAVGVGFLAGYGFGSLVVGPSESERYYDEEEYDEGDGRATVPRSYAALAPAVTASARDAAAPSMQAESPDRGIPAQSGGGILDLGPDSSPSAYSITGGGEASTAASEPEKPGLISRFKESRAYDRLQEEVSTIGERVLEELSRTAQSVVLPALFNKIKEMIGVDLSRQQTGGRGGAAGAQATGGGRAEEQQRTASPGAGGAGQALGASASTSQTSGGASQSARAGGSAAGGSSSYGTSENIPYGSPS